MARWTEREDAILRENAARGPGWEGLRVLLPNRTYEAICNRRQKLGIQQGAGGVRKGTKARRPRDPREAWTDEQRIALVRDFKAMVDASGHQPRECLRELGRIVRAYRRGAL